MTNIYKILYILIVLQFSLFNACADDNNGDENNNNNEKTINHSEKLFEVVDRDVNSILLSVNKNENNFYLFLSDKENVEFITHNDYTFNNLVDTINYSPNNDFCIGKFVSDTSLKLLVNNLYPNYDYYLTVFNSDSSVIHSEKISTLINEPTDQALQIVNINSTDNSATITWTNGNGNNRIIVVSKDSMPEFPKDGTIYTPNNSYGNKASLISKGTYVVYDSKNNEQTNLSIENLSFGSYYVQIFEYNGNGEHINYNTKQSRMNPVIVQPTLPAPKNLSSKLSQSNTYIIEWEKMNDTVEYELQVATDEKFNKILNNYKDLKVGNSNVWEIPYNAIDNNLFYYRVRAVYGVKKSNYSQIKRVEKK